MRSNLDFKYFFIKLLFMFHFILIDLIPIIVDHSNSFNIILDLALYLIDFYFLYCLHYLIIFQYSKFIKFPIEHYYFFLHFILITSILFSINSIINSTTNSLFSKFSIIFYFHSKFYQFHLYLIMEFVLPKFHVLLTFCFFLFDYSLHFELLIFFDNFIQ